MSWARPGVKCVCVQHGSFTKINPGPQIWTISATFVCRGELHAVFSELLTGGEIVTRFRPIISKTQEQDVEMFLRLASPSPLERLDLLAERMNELAED